MMRARNRLRALYAMLLLVAGSMTVFGQSTPVSAKAPVMTLEYFDDFYKDVRTPNDEKRLFDPCIRRG